MKEPQSGKNNLVTWCRQQGKEYLLEEWDYEKNDLGPENYFPKSEKEVFWKCIKEPHSYPSPICFRTNYETGCCYCSGKRVLQGFNDFKTWCKKNSREELLEEWDYGINKTLPEEVTRTSHKKIFWKCKKCNNTYEARLADRTSKKSGCPYCSGRKPIEGKTDLETWCKRNQREDLLLDWNDELNSGNTAKTFSYASNKRVIWKCHICGNIWTNPIYARTVGNGGCTKCCVAGTSFPEQYIFLTVKTLFNSAVNRDMSQGFELDVFIPEEKIGIEYNGAYFHENATMKDKIKLEKCKNRNIHLLQIIEDRDRRQVNEESIIYWQYSRDKKNLEDLADQVIRWIALSTGNRLKTLTNIDKEVIYKHARSNTYNTKYENSLEYKSPQIAQEWDNEHNDGIMPSQISNGSKDEAFWICGKCGNVYKMKISWRTRKNGAGCPICGKEKRIRSWIENRVKVKSFYDWCTENSRQDLLEEWDFQNNDKTPKHYSSGSNQKIWWKCKKCGNQWQTSISNRKTSKCNICSRMKRKKAVDQFKDNVLIAEYNSIKEASEATGVNIKSIRNVLTGKQEYAGGYCWQYRRTEGSPQ